MRATGVLRGSPSRWWRGSGVRWVVTALRVTAALVDDEGVVRVNGGDAFEIR